MEEVRSGSLGNVIRSKLFPPLFIVRPHDLGFRQVKLPRPQEPQQGLIVVSVISELLRLGLSILGYETLGEELGSELLESGLLGLISVRTK